MAKYVFHWKAILTGATGHGKPLEMTEEMAKSTVADMNRRNASWTTHWYVEVNEEQAAQALAEWEREMEAR